MPRRLAAAILLLCLLATPAAAEVAADHYNRGNKLYAQNNFEEALAAYEAALDAGADDPDLYLNLGNSAFRLNQVGLAVWAYEMGLRLAPRDGDLRFNLRYADAFLRDEMPPTDQIFILRVGRAVALYLTAGEALAGAAAGWLLLGLAAILWRPWRHRRGLVILIGALGLLLLFCFGPLAAWRVHDQLAVAKAVVTADEAAVRVAPAPAAKEAFVIHAGMRLEISETRDEYARVRIPTGLDGWIERQAFREIAR